MYNIADKVFKAFWRFHQLDGYALAIIYLVLGFVMFMLSGCSTIRYREDGAEFERTSFGTLTQISEFTVNRNPDGRITFGMKGYQSDQVQAISAVAEGVAKGLGSTVNP